MPKQRKQTKEITADKWIVSFKERQAFLTCPFCHNTINYNIVNIPEYCDRCHTKLEGIKENG